MTRDSLIRALEAAESHCAGRGEKLTPVRRRVLELVLEADAPVKAYDLLEALKPGPGAAKPPTPSLPARTFGHAQRWRSCQLACATMAVAGA